MVGPFVCQKTGDCCRDVVMTHQEWEAIRAVRPDAPIPTLHQDERFVEYRGPCPLLEGRLCGVYPVRPYACRRFQCWKQPGESYEQAMAYWADRMRTVRVIRREYAQNQRKSQKWALAHGWTPDMEG